MADGNGGERVVHIRSFRSCFTVERRIHKLDRWRVPLPYGVPVRGLAYFVVASVTLLVLSSLPLFGTLLNEFNTFTRLVLIPGAIAFVLHRVTLDGRPSHAAAVAWIRMHAEPGRMSGFRRLDTPDRVTLGSALLAPDERSSRMRAGVIEGPAEVVLRYAAEAHTRRDELRLKQAGDEPLWRGKRVRLDAGQRVVVG